MELVNGTGMPAAYTLGLDPDGREHVVVIVKGTFTIPADDAPPTLATEQAPLVMADEFTGEPGFSATVYESEFCLYKPRCDVLLNGSAHAPGGNPVQRVRVGLRVGAVAKSFDVVGDRLWEEGGVGTVAGSPQRFVRMPITYDRAYGGIDVAPDDPAKMRAYAANPVGVGYYPIAGNAGQLGRPLPNTEETGGPITSGSGDYVPMSFGAIGRNFASRVALAGTYDQDWLDNVFPFLPRDFDPLYYQAAPADQQIDHPAGGEWVELYNLTAEGYTRFTVPEIEMPVEFTNARYERNEVRAVIDTILIEPDLGRFSLAWRASRPLRRNIMEMRHAVVGRMSSGWYRARAASKQYHPSLGHFVASERARTS